MEQDTSKVVDKCQVCGCSKLDTVIFLGFLPPVNTMRKIGEQPHEQPSYPANVLVCNECSLVQLGLVVSPKILFSSQYLYTSSTTKILRENFAELYQESSSLIELKKEDLIVDIGSNDGNLLSNFKDNHKVLGVTPEKIGEIAIGRGIPTIIDYFNGGVVEKIKAEYGNAKIITATNVFAHIGNINEILENIISLLVEDGVFISESHYLLKVLETLQYDTVYHEHLRYYSLHSLKYLLNKHNLEVFHAKEIPTHGGSIRVYAAKEGKYEIKSSVGEILEKEQKELSNKKNLQDFKKRVVISKLELHSLLLNLKKEGKRVYGVGAPSRASTLINYVGIDDGIMDCVLEIKGSHKIGKYIPGTLIPVLDESKLYEDQPEYVLMLSWHIAEELAPKIKKKGYKGDFIIPLPVPHILHLD
jgi:hypothetical protein